MRAVIQRVRQAEVQVDGVRRGAIGLGLLVLACRARSRVACGKAAKTWPRFT